MNSNKKTARIVGALFLIAMVTSLLGIALLDPILNAQDYLSRVSANSTQVIIAVLLDLVNCAAVVGIAAVMMFPIFKKYNEALAFGYIGFWIIECVAIIASDVSLLSLVSLSQEYVRAGAPDASHFQTAGTMLVAARAHWAGLMLGIFFALGALLFYYLLYQSRLVPRWLSGWGLIAAALVLTWNLLDVFGISAGMIFALPTILNEIFLGIWLIVKGFNPSAPAPESAQTGSD